MKHPLQPSIKKSKPQNNPEHILHSRLHGYYRRSSSGGVRAWSNPSKVLHTLQFYEHSNVRGLQGLYLPHVSNPTNNSTPAATPTTPIWESVRTHLGITPNAVAVELRHARLAVAASARGTVPVRPVRNSRAPARPARLRPRRRRPVPVATDGKGTGVGLALRKQSRQCPR